MIISHDIQIQNYGLGTYVMIVTDKYAPNQVCIVVDTGDLRKLRDEINKIIDG